MPYFIHADIDAFYASVEQLDTIEYRGKPVIVGGYPDDRRGVVSAASYEARKFGVHSAMPIAQAHKLCPEGIFVRGRMGRYEEMSAKIMAIFEEFSPDVQQLSIDEAFLDITGTEGLFGTPRVTAQNLKSTVLTKTGLTVSVGLASNKYVAKIASGMSKPDGLFIIAHGDEEKFMRSLPVQKIWGAGEKTQEVFKKYAFKTGDDIFRLSLKSLQAMFGNSFGNFLYQAVRGQAAETFERDHGSHSMSTERTFAYDVSDTFELETTLLDMCESIIFRLLSSGMESFTVSLKIRYSDFSTEVVRQTFAEPILTVNDLYKHACQLFHKKYQRGRPVRLIGTGLMNLATKGTNSQSSLFENSSSKERRLEESILRINEKYPKAALKRGRLTNLDT